MSIQDELRKAANEVRVPYCAGVAEFLENDVIDELDRLDAELASINVMSMINDQWVHAFIAELCRRHPEVIDWPSDEIPDIIELIESKRLQNCGEV